MTKEKKRTFKILTLAALLLIAVMGGVLLREYLMLRRIQATLKSAGSALPAQKDAKKEEVNPTAIRQPLIAQVSRSADGSRVKARVGFAAFKKMVESHPELISRWGRVGWKVLEDIPGLCLRSLAADAPFRVLGVEAGDCITHIDGETVNQPMRNMGIWLTLGARSRLIVDTLRGGRRISYELSRY